MPTYFEMMGPHFVTAAQETMGEEWRKDLERHWLVFFDMFSYTMNYGWNLQCAEEKRREKQLSGDEHHNQRES